MASPHQKVQAIANVIPTTPRPSLLASTSRDDTSPLTRQPQPLQAPPSRFLARGGLQPDIGSYHEEPIGPMHRGSILMFYIEKEILIHPSERFFWDAKMHQVSFDIFGKSLA